MSLEDYRHRTWEIVEAARPGDTVSRLFDLFIMALILINVVAVVFGTVEPLATEHERLFTLIEVVSVGIFTVEYLLRLWSATADPRFRGIVIGRARFAVRPLSVIDLLAIAPAYLPFLGLDLRVLRFLRVFRIFRLLKLGRYSSAFRLIGRVIARRREELVLSLLVLLILLVISASLMYSAEHEAQPEAFSDIPQTMWWAVVTLTTVGYGDVFPVTGLGRVLAAIISILGIGMVALPAGIIGSGFVEEIAKGHEPRMCPHCGEPLE